MKRRRYTVKNPTRTWFNNWSNQYDTTLGSIGFHRELLKLVVSNSGVKHGDRVLDIGCGTGLLSQEFLCAANCHITGIDNSVDMLLVFKEKITRLGLEKNIGCTLSSVESLKMKNNTIDIAAATVVLHHLKSKVPYLRKIYRFLKPGGTFIIGEADMDTSGEFSDPQRLKRIVHVLEEEWAAAIREAGIEAFAKMYDNGKKHILNDGEYCVSLKQWAAFCKEAGFERIAIKRVTRYPSFGIVIARKGA